MICKLRTSVEMETKPSLYKNCWSECLVFQNTKWINNWKGTKKNKGNWLWYCKHTQSSLFLWTVDRAVNAFPRVYQLARSLHTWICGCGFWFSLKRQKPHCMKWSKLQQTNFLSNVSRITNKSQNYMEITHYKTTLKLSYSITSTFPSNRLFTLTMFTLRGMVSLVLKTGNQNNSLLSYPLPLPVLCKEQMQNVQAHVLHVKPSLASQTSARSSSWYKSLLV